MNERFPIIIFLYNIENNNDNGTKSEKVMNKYVKEWMIIEKIILEKKYKILKENKKAFLIKFFSDKNNEKTLLAIFSKNAYDCFIQENIQNLNNNNYKEDLNLKNNNKEKKLEEINKITSNTKTQTNQKEEKKENKIEIIEKLDENNENVIKIEQEKKDEQKEEEKAKDDLNKEAIKKILIRRIKEMKR